MSFSHLWECPVHGFERRACDVRCAAERRNKRNAARALRTYWWARAHGMRPLRTWREMTHCFDDLCPDHWGTGRPCTQWCLPRRVAAHAAAQELKLYWQSGERRLYEAAVRAAERAEQTA